jgi:hypothetical protein
MFSFSKCFLLLFCFVLVLVRASIAPIWISPTNYSTDVPEHTATKGEWTSIDIGAGSRGLKPVVHVDSKGTTEPFTTGTQFGITIQRLIFTAGSRAEWILQPKII